MLLAIGWMLHMGLGFSSARDSVGRFYDVLVPLDLRRLRLGRCGILCRQIQRKNRMILGEAAL
jgi:hypothetical protein